MRRHIACALAALALLAGAAAAPGTACAQAPAIGYRIVAVHPHDRSAFTQGLLLHDGRLYESTGLYGRSDVRIVDPASGRVIARRGLAPQLFGEGLARVGDRLYQLTWQSGRGFVYAAGDLRVLGEFRYRGEGWGLAFDGERLLMSDGSHLLRFLDPEGFRETIRVPVRDGDRPIERLNELEFVDGSVFANVWTTDRIARIDPASGRVTGWLDLSGLLDPRERSRADVLNGIAWEPRQRRLWVTGKLWPKMFVLELE